MTEGGQEMGPQEQLPRLRCIELVESIINDVGLADILSRCPGLQTLRIT